MSSTSSISSDEDALLNSQIEEEKLRISDDIFTVEEDDGDDMEEVGGKLAEGDDLMNGGKKEDGGENMKTEEDEGIVANPLFKKEEVSSPIERANVTLDDISDVEEDVLTRVDPEITEREEKEKKEEKMEECELVNCSPACLKEKTKLLEEIKRLKNANMEMCKQGNLLEDFMQVEYGEKFRKFITDRGHLELMGITDNNDLLKLLEKIKERDFKESKIAGSSSAPPVVSKAPVTTPTGSGAKAKVSSIPAAPSTTSKTASSTPVKASLPITKVAPSVSKKTPKKRKLPHPVNESIPVFGPGPGPMMGPNRGPPFGPMPYGPMPPHGPIPPYGHMPPYGPGPMPPHGPPHPYGGPGPDYYYDQPYPPYPDPYYEGPGPYYPPEPSPMPLHPSQRNLSRHVPQLPRDKDENSLDEAFTSDEEELKTGKVTSGRLQKRICPICNRIITKSMLRQHVMINHHMNKLPCPYCPTRCSSRKRLRKHMDKAHKTSYQLFYDYIGTHYFPAERSVADWLNDVCSGSKTPSEEEMINYFIELEKKVAKRHEKFRARIELAKGKSSGSGLKMIENKDGELMLQAPLQPPKQAVAPQKQVPVQPQQAPETVSTPQQPVQPSRSQYQQPTPPPQQFQDYQQPNPAPHQSHQPQTPTQPVDIIKQTPVHNLDSSEDEEDDQLMQEFGPITDFGLTTRQSKRVCPVCEKIIKKKGLKEHLLVVHHLKKVGCPVCKKEFLDRKWLIMHLVDSHDFSKQQYESGIAGKFRNAEQEVDPWLNSLSALARIPTEEELVEYYDKLKQAKREKKEKKKSMGVIQPIQQVQRNSISPSTNRATLIGAASSEPSTQRPSYEMEGYDMDVYDYRSAQPYPPQQPVAQNPIHPQSHQDVYGQGYAPPPQQYYQHQGRPEDYYYQY